MEKTVSNPPPPLDQGPTFDVTEFVLFALGRYSYWIVAFALVGLVFGISKALKLPNTYSSEGQFLVRAGARERRTPETSLTERDDPRSVQTPGLWEEIHLLDTPELYRLVAEELGPDRIRERYDPLSRDYESTPKLTRWMHELQTKLYFPARPDRDEAEDDEEGREESEQPSESTSELDPDEPEIDPRRIISPLDSAARVIRARTKMAPKKASRGADQGSRVVVISYEAYSPELAQDVVRSLMKMIRVRHRDIFSAPYQDTFIDEQLGEAELAEENARQAYFDHVDECGFFDIPMQKKALDQNIRQGEAAIDEALIQEEVATDELAETTRELESLEPEEIISGTLKNPLILNLFSAQASVRKEIRDIPYAEGSERYNEERSKLEDKIAGLEQDIRDEQASIRLEGGTHDPILQSIENRRYEKLAVKLPELRTKLSRLKIEIERNEENLAADEERLSALLACEPHHGDLEREKGKTVRRADELVGAKNNDEVLDLMDQNVQMSNLVHVQYATYEPTKMGPGRSKSLIMGLVGGLAVGVAFALARQLLDPRLRFPKNIERTLGLRVLGVIPEQARWRRLGRSLRKAS